MKNKLLKKHLELVRAKKYDKAKLLLQFIIHKQIVLALTDAGREMVWMLEQMGCRSHYHITDSKATVYLKRK